MLLIYMLIAYVSSNDFVTLGLNTSFMIIPDTSSECSDTDFSCYFALCDTLKHKNSCYAVLAPTQNVICTQMPNFMYVNMIVFGIDINRQIQTTSKCSTIGECFMKGCMFISKYQNVAWSVFTGECYYTFINDTRRDNTYAK